MRINRIGTRIQTSKAKLKKQPSQRGGSVSTSTGAWLEEDASQLVMGEQSIATSSISDRQNVSSQYLAAAAMAAATAALDAHASHDLEEGQDDTMEEDMLDEEDNEEDLEGVETRRNMMDAAAATADSSYADSDRYLETSDADADMTDTRAGSPEKQATSTFHSKENAAQDAAMAMHGEEEEGVVEKEEEEEEEGSPLWESQDSSSVGGVNKQHFDEEDLSRVISRIASLDSASAANSAIAKPLWDMLLRSGSLMYSGGAAESAPNGGQPDGGVSPLSRRRIRQTEIRERHRMYKKLLKAQIKALKIEEVEEEDASVLSTSGEMGDDGRFDGLGSTGGHAPFPLRSNSDAHQARVELIRETRLKKELRRAAKARLIRRKRKEELVVDKLFTAALQEERRRLAIDRAEARRAQKMEEQARQEKLLAIEHQYTEHRKMLAEQDRLEQRERNEATHAQNMEFKSMARELRDQKRQRFQQLIEQLDRQDQQDTNSDWMSGLGAEMEGTDVLFFFFPSSLLILVVVPFCFISCMLTPVFTSFLFIFFLFACACRSWDERQASCSSDKVYKSEYS